VIEDDEIDFEALMSEPPGGENHGRVRTDTGWRDLETGETFSRSPAIREDIGSRTRHGTLYWYTKRECRCPLCRLARAEYDRARRANPL
jgi:hypothetical protein